MHLIPYSAAIARWLAPLFSHDCPIPIRLWAALDGLITCQIVVDDPAQPTIAMVQELTEGTTYLAGGLTSSTINDGFRLLCRKKEVVVCLWPHDPIRAVLPPTPVYVGTAVDCTQRAPTVDLTALANLPNGYELCPIDAALVPALAGYDFYSTMFGGSARALAHTIGYCILHGEQVVSEAVAGPLVKGIAELGVGTADAYRQQGLATIAAARTIQACEEQGYQAFWNAAQQNAASLALARRLGFRKEQPFDVLVWEELP